MKNDRKHRKSKARVDGLQRRELIQSARHFIYNMARPVNSDKVENLLKGESYVPTNVCRLLFSIGLKLNVLQNAFSDCFESIPGFNMFDMFVVDLLHEIEIGVWKSLFIHLLRLLQAVHPSHIQELDQRCAIQIQTRNQNMLIWDDSFRNMPTFGVSTIRRFSTNSSEMKKMAAHNFEDILQVLE